MSDHPVTKKGVEQQAATCRCGHKGRSQNPDYYQCTACYNENVAKSRLEQADKLEARAVKYRDEAMRRRIAADEFRTRHNHPLGASWD